MFFHRDSLHNAFAVFQLVPDLGTVRHTLLRTDLNRFISRRDNPSSEREISETNIRKIDSFFPYILDSDINACRRSF